MVSSPVAQPVGCACELEIDVQEIETVASEAPSITTMQFIQEFAAEQVARMEVTRPEVLRTVPAYVAFQNGAEALRAVRLKPHWYERSSMSQSIGAFWSHSWHGERWQKIFTLMVLYNGLPAIVFGLLASYLSVLLFLCDVLPGVERIPDNTMSFSTWSLVSGSVVSFVVFVSWRSRERVFFDRVCLHQTDQDLKTAGILSLAGILRQSKTMLVLWDSTYSHRLWCLFEFAAFLKSAEMNSNVLIIKPTFIGPTAILTFLGALVGLLPMTVAPIDQLLLLPAVGFVVLLGLGQYFACTSLRSYFRAVDEMQRDLRHMRADEAKCSCCTQGHVDSEGQALICDREVVQECIRVWFRDQGRFEEHIQTEVVEVLVYNLRCQALPYRWRVAISTPAFWACLDLVASLYKNGMIEMAVEWLLLGFMLWLFAGPMVLSWFVFLCRRLSTKKRLDLLQTLAVIFGVMPLVVVLAGFFVYLQVTMADPLLRAGLFAIAVFCFSLASWCLQSSARSFHSKVKPHPET
ncbi:Uncharacterized protein SCF082_LOCUS12349 [Durusdinium trenchii]|uniref:Uncharacterized protein n=1 Tax=Durusdinium trenchii TaxID=1381693 RepID=A0ABP0JJL5_9DINO